MGFNLVHYIILVLKKIESGNLLFCRFCPLTPTLPSGKICKFFVFFKILHAERKANPSEHREEVEHF